MKAADDGDGAFRYSRRAQPKKGGKDTPGNLCFCFGSGTYNAAKSVWHSGLGFPFLKKKKKEEKKRMTHGKEIGEEEKGKKSLREGNRASA